MEAIEYWKQRAESAEAKLAEQSSSLKALATLNNRLWQWTSRMSYNASYVGEPDGMVKGHIREMEKILDTAGKQAPSPAADLATDKSCDACIHVLAALGFNHKTARLKDVLAEVKRLRNIEEAK